MAYEQFVPYIISILLTIVYASVGKLSSGEPFNMTKFAETIGVQITALVAFAATSYVTGIDLSALTTALPTVITAVVMKLYSWYKKTHVAPAPITSV